MKKAYKKPMLYVERFALSQTIAHNCGENLDFSDATQDSKEICGWFIGNVEIFADPSFCANSSDFFDFICYNAPEGGFNIFSS